MLMNEYPLDPNPYCLTSCDERGFHDVICSPPFFCPNFSQTFSFCSFLSYVTGLAAVAFPVLAGLPAVGGTFVEHGAVGDGSPHGSFSWSLDAKGVVGSGRSSLLLPRWSASSSEVLGVTVMTIASGLLDNGWCVCSDAGRRRLGPSHHICLCNCIYIYEVENA